MTKLSIIWIVLVIITLMLFALFIYKADNYFDTMVEYESLRCQSDAYMIYKKYDDQNEEIRTRDWLIRISECAGPEAEYLSNDF